MIAPVDFLQSAKDMLASSSTEEVIRRNCISRAYYSAYHACKFAADSMGIGLTDGDCGTHAKLIKALKGNGKTYYLGTDLNNLKKLRVKADYLLSTQVTIKDANVSISQAESLLKDVSKLFASQSVAESE